MRNYYFVHYTDLVFCEILSYILVCRNVAKVEKYGLCLCCYTGINIENLRQAKVLWFELLTTGSVFHFFF